MGSFKLRLVIYFMLLALLPLVAATVAFSEVAERGETGSADSRLSTAIRVAQADYQEQLDVDAAETARSLAHATMVQEALADRNRSALVGMAKQVEHSAFYTPGGEFLAGVPPGQFDGSRSFKVKDDEGKALGSVVVHIPFDDFLAKHLGSHAALNKGDLFAFVADDRVIAPSSLKGALGVPLQRPRFVSIDGVSYRAVGTNLLGESAGRPPVAIVALSPKAAIDKVVSDLRTPLPPLLDGRPGRRRHPGLHLRAHDRPLPGRAGRRGRRDRERKAGGAGSCPRPRRVRRLGRGLQRHGRAARAAPTRARRGA